MTGMMGVGPGSVFIKSLPGWSSALIIGTHWLMSSVVLLISFVSRVSCRPHACAHFHWCMQSIQCKPNRSAFLFFISWSSGLKMEQINHVIITWWCDKSGGFWVTFYWPLKKHLWSWPLISTLCTWERDRLAKQEMQIYKVLLEQVKIAISLYATPSNFYCRVKKSI